MEKIDRLSTLMSRFRLSARAAPLGEATLIATRPGKDDPGRLFLGAVPVEIDLAEAEIVVAARVDWGSDANPLFQALPELMVHDLSADEGTRQLLSLIDLEIRASRCGADSVIGRLTEVLLVRLLRGQIESGAVETGLLAGLSDPRLSRSIVAIHDHPERLWTNEDLAQVAGLSLSRFVELFQTRVGETPAAYLRRWRLTLARQDLVLGARVERVAHRYGFRSAEGFSRAFKRQFGQQPRALRRPSATDAQPHSS
ncbi:AraC family transcriptional regulator [Tropicimonas sp. TH_r6]|uniref:AraC family transcriptional regulator n=1 Tax=Tropicimonas sp. TH_r6 TaxID=3082085 RepID=UPI002953552F|nr:AraC family transcriptional regulator [Tropicimonas sp. TH_r6]MDV7143476.1 AraC family transcriptional regulator [Tropicimonas sp. TH_r6]